MSDFVSRHLALDDAEPIKVIQVRGTTNPKALAGSIAEEYRQAMAPAADGTPLQKVPNISMHAIGHQAVGQAIKAVPIANSHLAPRGLQLTILPSFEDKMVPSETDPNVKVERTVMRLRLLVWMIGG